MKKQRQIEMDQDEILDREFGLEAKKYATKKAQRAALLADIVKYIRIVQIASMVLVTVLLVEQDFLYAQILGAFSAVSTAERVWRLVFRAS